jgi:ATP-binding cassette subfamily B protein
MATLNQRRSAELASRLANDVEVDARDAGGHLAHAHPSHGDAVALHRDPLLDMSVKLALFMVGTIPVVIVLIAIFRLPHPQADQESAGQPRRLAGRGG